MELIRGLHNLRACHHGCVATIGNYDGVHRGHQAVLALLREKSRLLGLPSTVMVFEPTPREFFSGAQAPPRISTFREKLDDLAASGIERVLCIRFDRTFSALKPQEFIQKLLIGGLGVGYLVVGDDFRFGHRREGDFALLQAVGAEQGFEVESMPAYLLNGTRVSSTRVREALLSGDIPLATQLLGHVHRIEGRVVKGKQLGRQLGVPTANIPLEQGRAIRYGVYVATVDTPQASNLPAAVSIGVRPAVAGEGCVLEAHLLDYSGDLYGQRISVKLHHYLRSEQNFPDLRKLKLQMEQDIAQVRAWLQERT